MNDIPLISNSSSSRYFNRLPPYIVILIVLVIIFIVANFVSYYLEPIIFKKEHLDSQCVKTMFTISSLLMNYQDYMMEKGTQDDCKNIYPLSFTDFLLFCKSDTLFHLTIDENNFPHPFHGISFPENIKFGHMVSISPRICELADDVAAKIPFFWRVGTNRFGLCDVQMLDYRKTLVGERGISKGQLHSYILAAAANPELHYRFYYPGHYLVRNASGDLELREIPQHETGSEGDPTSHSVR